MIVVVVEETLLSRRCRLCFGVDVGVVDVGVVVVDVDVVVVVDVGVVDVVVVEVSWWLLGGSRCGAYCVFGSGVP